jgi:putative lipoprotein
MRPRPLALSLAALLSFPGLARAQQASAADPDPWLGRDKALHFTASTVMAGSAYGLGVPYTDHLAQRIAFGAGLSLAIGAGKELFDLAGFGNPSWKDLTWDVVGTAVGVGIAVTLDLAFRLPAPTPVR